MFHCWIPIVFVIIHCNAQDHLTCLRTDDVIKSATRTATTNVQQGRPGRRGPQGQKGDSVKGMKGEPAIPDHSLIESLRDNITRDLRRGYMELDDGWITPFNGYQYKASLNRQTWDESRSVCQSWEGDLIVHGFRDHTARVTIKRALHLTDYYYWIGLNDKQIEGHWLWVNAVQAIRSDVTLWRPSQPNNLGGNENCAVAVFRNNDYNQFLAKDTPCFNTFRAICEKLT